MKLASIAKSEIQALWNGWDRFWFDPLHPASLGLLRILAGGMLVYTHLVWGLRLSEFFGDSGWQDPLLVGVFQREGTAQSFWWLVPAGWMWPVHWACVAVLICFMMGLCTRVTSLLSLAIVISYAHRVPLATFGLDQINCLLTLYQAIGPSGACFSIDRLLKRRKQAALAIAAGATDWCRAEPARASARLATRLVQLHMCVLYLAAGLAKLKGEAWWDGNAIWLGAANFEYQSGDLTWLAWHPWIGNFLTHTTVIWETTFWIFVWRPKLRPFVLLAGVMMHAGIGLFLGMWTFGLVMIFTYLAYVPPEMVLRAQARLLAFRRATVLEYTDRFWSRWWTAWRCAMFLGTPPRLRHRVSHKSTAPVTAPGLPPSPAAWWQWVRRQWEGAWPFLPAEGLRTALPRRIVVMSSRVAIQINLEQRLRSRGLYCRTAADVPAVASTLASLAGQCVVFCVHHPEELADVGALRDICLAAGKLAPITVTAIDKSMFHKVSWPATIEHRLISPPFSCADLLVEIGQAWAQRMNGEAFPKTCLAEVIVGVETIATSTAANGPTVPKVASPPASAAKQSASTPLPARRKPLAKASHLQ